MRRSLAVLAGLALCVAAPRAHANPAMQRVVIDRVELEPSTLYGFARLRVFVSAVDLAMAGKVMDVYGDHGWKLRLAGSEQAIPYVTGFYGGADVDTAIVVVVEKASDYADDLKQIQDALDQELLAKLPARTQVAVIGYGDELVAGKLGAAKAAQSKLAALSPEDSPGSPNLLGAIDKALVMLRKVKTDPEGLPVRKMVLVVSDGRDKNDDRAKVTALGKKAAQQGVRIHAIAYTGPNGSKQYLLNLGELSKQSLGTFRWAQKPDAIRPRIQNAELELDHQYVLTWLVAADDVVGKKIQVTAQITASQSIDSNEAKVPATATCANNECPEDGYCAADRCVERAKPKGTSILSWLLILIAAAVGLLAVLVGIGFAMTKLRKRPMPGAVPGAPFVPGAPGVPAPAGAPPPGIAAPAPAPAAPVVPVGPQLYFMTGPRSGQRIGLRHGFLIGKQPGCDLVLEDDGFASSQHAQILMDAGGNCTLIDKGSTNGTYVNGVRVSQYALTHGVAIRVGSTELRFLAQ